MALNFAVTGHGTLTNQPSEVEVIPIQAHLEQVATGGWVAHKRTKGARIRVTWGLEMSKTAVLAELRTARGSTVNHTITFTDASATAHSYSVLWPGDPPFREHHAELYRRITIEFVERP
jgi:hypothetical protein